MRTYRYCTDRIETYRHSYPKGNDREIIDLTMVSRYQ